MESLDTRADLSNKTKKLETKELLKRLKLNDFVSAWYFLKYHAIFKSGADTKFPSPCLHIRVLKVDSQTNRIYDLNSKNTKPWIFLECYPIAKSESSLLAVPSVDTNLNCGAPTFEKAIIKLAKLVLEHYGQGR